MCYSYAVNKSIREMEKDYEAEISWPDFIALYRQRTIDGSFFKIPDGMDSQLFEMGGKEAEQIRDLRIHREVADIEGEMHLVKEAMATKFTKKAESRLGVLQRKRDKLLKPKQSSIEHDGYRIYPGDVAPVIIRRGPGRSIVPMRYNVLPASGIELPSKYPVFNARRDMLRLRDTWRPLFGKTHGIAPFTRFFEWVDRGGKTSEVFFKPRGFERMHAACLYAECQKEDFIFRSFAIITDEPNPEILEVGHDRCPIFIAYSHVDSWLNPSGQTLDELDALLGQKESVYFNHAFVADSIF
jgi:putative SOS response-associated peptidase YedK